VLYGENDQHSYYDGEPMENAIQGGHVEVMKILHDNGADLNDEEEALELYDGVPMQPRYLLLAVTYNKPAVVRWLLKSGQVNAYLDGESALMKSRELGLHPITAIIERWKRRYEPVYSWDRGREQGTQQEMDDFEEEYGDLGDDAGEIVDFERRARF
jgi:hypothetical protein